MKQSIRITSRVNKRLYADAIPGHFATNHSHINYYIDMTSLKSRRSEAHAAAKVLATRYAATTIIDTIVCLDGTNVIGAYLADELLNTGILSANLHNTAYIISPEQHSGGQLIFRENYLSMIKGKHVLVLLATATTGKTLQTALECIEYYGGEVVGVSSIFSAADEIHDEQINTIFRTEDIPNYETHSAADCPLCKAGIPIKGIINSHGYSSL